MKIGNWIRWKGLYWIAIFALVPLAYLRWGLDLHLKWELESVGSQLNGALVNIGKVRTHLLSNRIEIENVQFGHRSLPMKNWLEIEKVLVSFEPGPLLKKKIIFSKVEVE